MTRLWQTCFYALLAYAAAGLFVATATADAQEPPNWKASVRGTNTTVGGGEGFLVDYDQVRGVSTHLGQFTGEGFHALFFADLTFVGYATWTSANGDQLYVTYTGAIVGPSGDPNFPLGAVAEFRAVGGTGRFANARGVANMMGAFTGTFPGAYYFALEGTLLPQPK